jgi:6-phosphofructokinase 1
MHEVDRSDDVVAAFHARGLDALVAIGGDGSLRIAYELFRKGIPVVGVPKTIDNDVAGTESSFGFDTAVSTATDALDKLHTTAESHDRVFVVELMGRYAGWIALHGGLSGSADVILIPEIPFDIDKVCEKILERERRGAASPSWWRPRARVPGRPDDLSRDGAPGRPERLEGIAEEVAKEIAARTGKETRSIVLGHLQQGGSPPPSTGCWRSLRLGGSPCHWRSGFGCCVVYPPTVGRVPLLGSSENQAGPARQRIITTARNLGICLGD